MKLTFNITFFAFLLFFSLNTPLILAQKNTVSKEYLKVEIDQTTTIVKLLELYNLSDNDCNFKQFFALNKLATTTKYYALLKAGKYTLPIFIYDYNGKNIRTSIGITDLASAKRIQNFNTTLQTKKLRKKSYQDSRLLWVNYAELNCKGEKKRIVPKEKETEIATTTPKPKKTSNKPEKSGKSAKSEDLAIFGKKYQNTPILSQKLKGKIFYVESGHGGPDPGASTVIEKKRLCEDEYAYDVALRVARSLIQQGATVFIITRDSNDGIRDEQFLVCDSDETTYPDQTIPAAHKPRLFQRSDAINELYEEYKKKGYTDQRLIVIHVDSRSKKEQIDTFLYYQSSSDSSKTIADNMQTVLEQKYTRDYKGTVSTRDLHMLRECKPTTVYVELGNIKNTFDRQRIMYANNRQAIANWLVEGLIK